MSPKFSRVAWIALVLVLAACHHDAAAPAPTETAAAGEDATPLPKPAPASGPVTGMPAQPGPGPVGLPAASSSGEPTLPPEAALATDAGSTAAANAPGATTATGAANAATPGATVATSDNPSAEPSAEDAAAVVRTYFSAIAGHDFARAHALWSEGGDASGHSVAQLAGEYADVASMDAAVGAPGRLDAAAGSRYIKVPVTLARSLRDGSTQHLAGTVALRRSVVDGATPEQRAWRIAWTDLRATPATPPAQ